MSAIKIKTIDLHAAGEPCRVIYDYFYDVDGSTMFDKKCQLIEHHEDIRRAMMLEPRGHTNMFGSILTRPVSENADAGVIFLTNSGYMDMCIHGSICTSRAVVELGVKLKNRDRVVFDTVGGQITAHLTYDEAGTVSAVEIENVPSFRFNESPIKVEVAGVGVVEADVVFAGNFFVIVDGDKYCDLPRVDPANYDELATIGIKIRDYVNANYTVTHPTVNVKGVSLAVIYNRKAESPKHVKNVVVFGDRQVDRSPCGTGTSGLMVHFVSNNELELGAQFDSESIIGSFFYGRLSAIGCKDTLGRTLYQPRVKGRPSLTARCEFVLEPADPYQFGIPMIF